MQCTKIFGRGLAASLFVLGAAGALAAPPTADTLRALGADMGRGQRCHVPVADVLLFSQLARDLAEKGDDPVGLQREFASAAGKAREADIADCTAAVARFDAALGELYRLNGRQR